MREYIEKEVARRTIDSGRTKEQMLAVLSSAVPADVRENVRGEWIKYGDKYKCNKCFATMQVNPINPKLKDRFCYFCGADMQKEVEE